ncbi:MAG TPA: ABC transporter ATP-binding protein [Deinococcales bacterium]|nr:ABC transporter ATP-binding protein [Deinococcales bacterium]
MPPDAIRFRNVSRYYGDQAAVRDLSLNIREGELVVLLGPSGCGKTTTLRMINRLINPSAGVIEVNGRDVAEHNPEELRRGIGYVIQATGLFPHLTVRQNIEVVPRLLGWEQERRRKRAAELLELVSLDPAEYLERFPVDLSGGQQQRVGVARALAADPPVLLMDEPFGAVDPITRERLQEEFLDLQNRLGKTVVFVTHDLDEAVKLADRVCLMRAGRVEQFAEPEELLRAPASPFVEQFTGPQRSLKLLGRITVGAALREEVPTDTPAEVSRDLDLRTALSVLLDYGTDTAVVVDEAGNRVGGLWLSDIARFSGRDPE